MIKIERGWNRKTIFRYSLFQLPGIFLIIVIFFIAVRVIEIPVWFIWAVIFGWIIKDIALFPFVWKAYDRREEKSIVALSGKKGVIVNKPDPLGTVLINGEFWQASAERPEMTLEKGTPVVVVNHENMILTIAEDSQSSNYSKT